MPFEEGGNLRRGMLRNTRRRRIPIEQLYAPGFSFRYTGEIYTCTALSSITTICRMKTLLHAFLCLAATVTTLQAGAIWTSNRDEEYLLSSDKDLSALSMGFGIESNDREVTYTRNGDVARDLDLGLRRYKGYIGYDLFQWLTVYGLAGGCRTTVSDEHGLIDDAGSADAEYGAGLRLNILDHVILDPLIAEDRIRLTASVQYTRSSFDIAAWNEQCSWFERRSSVQFSIINDIRGNPLFRPESIALNVGYVYSDIEGDHGIDEVTAGWITVGGEIFYSKRISFGGNVFFSNNDDTRGMEAGFHFRF